MILVLLTDSSTRCELTNCAGTIMLSLFHHPFTIWKALNIILCKFAGSEWSASLCLVVHLWSHFILLDSRMFKFSNQLYWYDHAGSLSPPLYCLVSVRYIIEGRRKWLECIINFGCPPVVSLDPTWFQNVQVFNPIVLVRSCWVSFTTPSLIEKHWIYNVSAQEVVGVHH